MTIQIMKKTKDLVYDSSLATKRWSPTRDRKAVIMKKVGKIPPIIAMNPPANIGKKFPNSLNTSTKTAERMKIKNSHLNLFD